MTLSPNDAARLEVLRGQLAVALDPDRVTKVASAGRSMEKASPDIKAIKGEIDALESAARSRHGRVRGRGSLTFRWSR